jgi:hypothetical protein
MMCDPISAPTVGEAEDDRGANTFDMLLAAPADGQTNRPEPTRIDGAIIGRLVGFADNGATSLVTYCEQPSGAALPARATLDLHAAHIGRDVVLMFEAGDPYRPIVIGCIHDTAAQIRSDSPEQLRIDADGHRLIVSANEQIVLRCGKASITLTKEGKVIIQGAYVSNQSSGVLRLKGGSVQIN